MLVGALEVGLPNMVFTELWTCDGYAYGMMGSGYGYGMVSGFGLSFFELLVVILLGSVLWVLISDRKNKNHKNDLYYYLLVTLIWRYIYF